MKTSDGSGEALMGLLSDKGPPHWCRQARRVPRVEEAGAARGLWIISRF